MRMTEPGPHKRGETVTHAGDYTVDRIGDGFWQVSHGDKWWTAKSTANFGSPYWLVINSRGRVVDSTGATGKRVIAAIKALRPTRPCGLKERPGSCGWCEE